MSTKPNWDKLRELIPACKNYVQLNTAGRAPVSKPVVDVVARYYQEALEHGNILWEDWLKEIEDLREIVGKAFNADKANIAFLPNSSLGLSFTAQMISNQNSSVVMSQDEFPSSSLCWLQKGFEVNFVKSKADGSISTSDFESTIKQNTKALVVSHVQFKTGFRHNLEELGELCSQKGIAFVVDCTQSVGAYRVDVKKCKIDFLVASGYKWPNAGCGTAMFYVSDNFKDSSKFPALGWRSLKNPYSMTNDKLELSEELSAVELGHPSFVTMFSFGTGLKHNFEIGLDKIEDRIKELRTYLRNKLDSTGFDILSARDEEHSAGITIVRLNKAEEIVKNLESKKILVAKRGEGIRVSTHYYNTEAEIDLLINELSP